MMVFGIIQSGMSGHRYSLNQKDGHDICIGLKINRSGQLRVRLASTASGQFTDDIDLVVQRFVDRTPVGNLQHALALRGCQITLDRDLFGKTVHHARIGLAAFTVLRVNALMTHHDLH
jgi:hypothetical protein